jgi:hypothetical protein
MYLCFEGIFCLHGQGIIVFEALAAIKDKISVFWNESIGSVRVWAQARRLPPSLFFKWITRISGEN